MVPLLQRILLTAILTAAGAAAQNIITTFAGTDWQFPGDGKRALDAPLGGAFGLAVAVDGQGNYFIADPDNRLVMKVGQDGILRVVAGNGILGYSGEGDLATNSSITTLRGIAVDPKGNLYIAEYARVRRVDPNGIITTIAGASDEAGFSGDGGPALTARFDYIFAIACDRAGNVYVVDQNNHRIRKIVPGGIVTTIAGNGKVEFPKDGTAVTASLNTPYGLAVDDDGNVYFTDVTPEDPSLVLPGGLVRGVTPAGVLVTVFASRINSPVSIAVEPDGNLVFVDQLNGSIYRISEIGKATLVAGPDDFAVTGFAGDGGPASKAIFNVNTGGIAADKDGSIYVADNFNNRIRRITPDGIIRSVAGNGRFRSANNVPATSAALYVPASLAIDPAGSVYIAEPFVNRIRKVTKGVLTTFAGTGDATFTGDNGPATEATLFWPQAVATDSAGSVYIADSFNNRIRKVTPDGIIRTVAGGGSARPGDGGPATEARLVNVQGVAVDAVGSIYIADASFHRIRKVAPDGIITTIAGTGIPGFSGDGGPATKAQIRQPSGIKVDLSGNIYFSDSGNNRVRKISMPSGIITTVAGTGAPGFSGDGGPAIQATFREPRGLALDGMNLYVVDARNYRVRRITLFDGYVRTVAGNGFTAFTGDGRPATDATLSVPYDVAVDAAGNLYIADFFNDRIRVVLATAPSFQVFPPTLSYNTVVNTEETPTKNLYITGSIPGLAFNLSGDRNWLKFSTTSGVTPATIQVSVDPTRIGADASPGSITVTAPGTSTRQQRSSVQLVLDSAAPRGLRIQSDALTFALFQGGAAASRTVTLANDSGETVSFRAVADARSSWLLVTPSTGRIPPRSQVSLQVSVNPAALEVATYSGSVLVTDLRDGDTKSLGVSATVSAVPKSIFLTQSGLTFTAVAGAGVTPPQSVGVVNLGRGIMNWTLAITDLGGNRAAWLAASPDTGASDAAAREVSQFTVSVNHAGLAPGDYYAQIQVKAPDADNSPQFLLVVLTVLPEGTNPGPIVQPTSLIFTGTAGGVSPGSQTITVSNLAAQPTSFTSGRISQDGNVWFTHIPAAGTVAPNQFTRFVVQPLVDGLAPGVYRGSLTMLFDGTTARTVNLVFIVAGAATSNTRRPGFRDAGGGCPTRLIPVFTSIGSETSVPAGWPQRLVVRVFDDCGVPMSAGAVTAQFSGNIPPLTLTSLKDGNWSGSWQSRNAATPTITIKVKAEIPEQQLQGTAEVTGNLTANQDPPVLDNTAPLNAASMAPNAPLAPGSLVTISGSKLAQARTAADSFPLPTQLAGTLVAIGGKAMPLVEVAEDRISAVLPYDLPVNTRVQMIVQRGSSAAVPETVTVSPVQPAIFTKDRSGHGQGQVYKLSPDGTGALAEPGAPVSAGDTILVQCTGLGAVEPAVPAGVAAPASPLAQVTAPVTLTIGDVKAEVQSAALQAGLSGIYSVIAKVPQGVAPGDGVPVVVSAGNQSSPPVTMAVR